MIDNDKKDFGAWWIWVSVLLIGTITVFSILGFAGKFSGTWVERKVFENSYQRSEGLKSQMLTWQAQLAQVNAQLMTTQQGSDLYNQLMSQKAMLEVQISQTQGMK